MQVEVSATKLSFPQACPCCGDIADGELSVSASKSRGKRVVHTTTRGWTFPYCMRCISHYLLWRQGEVAGLIGFFVMLGAVGWIWLGPASAVLAAVPVVATALYGNSKKKAARALCGASCVCPGASVSYEGWYGSTHTFSFVSPQYASAFMAQNERKLINMSAAASQALSDGRRAARVLAAPHPVAALPAASSEQVVLKWITKIESLKGPAARRAAVQAALQELVEPTQKQRIVLEASKIEVQAALDKADGLKTISAKRRTLESALEAIRHDDVDDALQSDQIAWLENALRELNDN